MYNRTAKKKQRKYYSGKKKRHTQKAQLIIDKKTKKIVCTAYTYGKKHDSKLYKESKTKINSSIKAIEDTAYIELRKEHRNCEIPKKKSKKNPLTKEDKKNNSIISSQRVIIENVIRKHKIFRIIGDRYRNRRKRFGLRLNLIAAFINRAIDLNNK